MDASKQSVKKRSRENELVEDDRNAKAPTTAAVVAAAGFAADASVPPTGGAGGRRSTEAAASDVSAVLKRVRELVAKAKAEKLASAGTVLTLADLGITGVREVMDQSPEDIMDGIEGVLTAITGSILKGEGFAYDVPSRTASNQLYVPELDRICLTVRTLRRFSP